MKMIKYYSTNKKSELVSFKEALLSGQAPDNGLYMPNYIPQLTLPQIASMKDLSYWEVAFMVTKEFLRDEISENELMRITKEAYNFEIPLENVFGKVYLMRLDQGPTASFKDFAARMLAYLMQYYLEKERRKLIILVATSGDTGGAIANAFYSLENLKVVVLFPLKEVTLRQRRQMTTLGENIIALAVEGKFDDCQVLVKQAFTDQELNCLDLSSANSINFGRLLPQAVYYFYAYSKLASGNEEVIFSVPSGNFGNLMGGLIAKKMGLPVYKFIAAVNENDEFPRFLETGAYQPIRPSRNCISSAMNVGHPSNLARLIDLYGGQMDEKGEIQKMPDMDSIKKDIFSVSISNSETKEMIKNVYQKYGVILEPHGAVGFTGLERFLFQTRTSLPAISLETAHPAKFPEELKKILDIEPELPESLKGLETKKEKFENISSNYQDFKQFLQDKL